MSALSVLGLVALTVGPWAQASAPTTRTILTFGWLVLWMLNILAANVGALLETQADQIAALQRRLAAEAER